MCPISECIRPWIKLAVDHAAAAEPGADRQVDKCVEPLGGAPPVFAQRSAVDIGVEADGHAQRCLERADKVSMCPVGLRRGGNIAVGGRPQVGIDRPKTRDADRRPVALPPAWLRKNATASGIASDGLLVGKRTSARISSGPLPTAHTNLVPPASIPPQSSISLLTFLADWAESFGVSVSQDCARHQPARIRIHGNSLQSRRIKVQTLAPPAPAHSSARPPVRDSASTLLLRQLEHKGGVGGKLLAQPPRPR